MQELLNYDITVGPGAADSSGLLGYAEAFGFFQDAAAQHAEIIGVGFHDMMSRSTFWLTVKTKVKFLKRPHIMQRVTVSTWPEAPGRMRGNRSYLLSEGDEPLIAGKTEWAVINTATGALVPLAGVYPAELTFPHPTACPEPFNRVGESFEGVTPYASYRVRSTDIDVGGHMNNTAYVRAVMGSLTTREIQALDVASIDVIFRSQCFEGDELEFRRVTEDGGMSIQVSRGGEAVLLVRLASYR